MVCSGTFSLSHFRESKSGARAVARTCQRSPERRLISALVESLQATSLRWFVGSKRAFTVIPKRDLSVERDCRA